MGISRNSQGFLITIVLLALFTYAGLSYSIMIEENVHANVLGYFGCEETIVEYGFLFSSGSARCAIPGEMSQAELLAHSLIDSQMHALRAFIIGISLLLVPVIFLLVILVNSVWAAHRMETPAEYAA